jgi:class 3 adenylate cyclase/predicted ATPase
MDAERPPRAVYRFERFTLDLSRGALLAANGAELPLRPKSFALLRLLVENAGRLLDRDAIMAAVWPDVFVTDDSITQCVREIRRALGDEPPRLLRTVQRRGYLFTAEVSRAGPAAAVPEGAAPIEGTGSQRPPAPEQAESKRLPVSLGAERRQLTVLFCDLVGSTALSERLDLEDFSEVIRAYQERCAAMVVSFGGHVAKYMGDGVLAYFGYPHAHEDAAERSVRAGLAIAGVIADMKACPDLTLQVRVGIATGLVVSEPVAEGAQGEAAVGKPLNLAARLQMIAEPGTVVIAESTRRLVGELFALEDLGRCPLKNFTVPMQAWRVTGEGMAEGRFEALRGAALTPLVGRDAELALLLERWDWAKSGEGQVVLLGGEAGIGKSRLVLALRERLRAEPRTSLRYHGSPYHAHSVLWPVIGQLERAAGLEPGDALETKLDKLESLLRQSGPAAATAPAVLAELLGIPAGDRYPPLRLTPEQRKAQTFRALLGQLEGLARQQPVLIVLEDAHWLDPTTLELFDLVVGRIETLPVLLVVTSRPEFRPAWTGRPHVTLLTLSRLGRSQAAEVVARVTDGKALPGTVLEQVLAKTDGIPLFVEELTKAVLEAGLLRQEGNRYVLEGPLPPLAIPDTLHGSLLARLDRLAPVKEVAQIGAVIGREFDHGLLAVVAGMEEARLADALQRLVEAELVFPRGVPPEATYAFKHVLVQEAAYGSLLKGRRQQLHARIADELERRSPETAAGRPEVLAYHLTEAGLTERALEMWGKAGALALARSAPQEAAAHLGRALRLVASLPPNDALKRREVELQGGLSAALSLARGIAAPEVEQAHLRARELADELGDSEGWFRAQWGLWRVYSGRAQSRRALEVARELLAAAEWDGDDGHLLQAHHGLWTSLVYRGEFLDARAHAERGRALYDPERHGGHVILYGGHDPGECALVEGGNALWFLGFPEQALRWQDEALALSERLGLPQVLAHVLNWTAIRAQLASDLPRLEAQVARVTRLATEHGFANWFPEARILAGWLAARRDRERAALGPMRDHLERRSGTGTALARTWLWLVLADACLAVGANAEAVAAAREGLAGAEASEERFCEAELHRVHAAALLAHDRTLLADAERALATAVAEARNRGARMSELRAAVDLARLWAERGARRDAYDLLAPVHGWFTEGFDTPDLRDAKALLDVLP